MPNILYGIRILDMKTIFILVALFFSIQAHADIYVCRDALKRIIYQDEPCTVEMVRKLKTVPPPSVEELWLAEERVRRSNEIWQQRAALAELQRRQDEIYALELEKIDLEKRKLELQDKQASEQIVPIYVNPNFSYGFNKHGFHRHEFNKFGANRPHNNKHGNFDSRSRRNLGRQH
jgi:hypothetical protein